jgi:hypothetical protein
VELLCRGQWLCARIEERYLTLYDLEEAEELSWLEKQVDLHADVREEAMALARYGFQVEPMVARREVELVSLRLPGAPPDPDGFLAGALDREIEALRFEREAGFAQAARAGAERHLKEAEDSYTRELFQEDTMRADWQIRFFGAQVRLSRALAGEFRARHESRWEGAKGQLLKERARIEKELDILELERQLLDNQEETRWQRNDAESEFPERRAEAKEKLKDLNAKRRALEEKIEAARKELEGAAGERANG